MVYLTTKRLILRDWKASDLEEFKKLNSDPFVMEYFRDVLSSKQTEQFYDKINEEIRTYGYGLYAVETKHNCEFIGFVGFHKATFKSFFTPCIEIGWRLKRDVWNKGYATEGAKACLEYGFNQLGFDTVYSFTSKVNKRSIRVMEKIGLTKLKEFDHPNLEKEHQLSRHVLYCKKNT